MHPQIEEITSCVVKSHRAVAFTGAGISTESGIADFRSPGGVWSKYQPVLFQDFLVSEEARRQYWLIKKEGYRELRNARPNRGHLALAGLEAAGRLVAVITQNIDGLHQSAGSRRVLELHGTSRYCICLNCESQFDPGGIQKRLEGGEEVPLCEKCGGFLKSATVSFGQPLPVDVLSDAMDLCTRADLMLALGSSLVVEPAASLPLRAKHSGAGLVIINKTSTPLDGVADIVLHEPIGEVLDQVVRRLQVEV